MTVCDRAGGSTQNAKDCLRSIIKRLGHPDPHVGLQACTVSSPFFLYFVICNQIFDDIAFIFPALGCLCQE